MELTGFQRKDGRIGIRNHVLVLPTVSCVNGVVQRIGREVPEAVCAPHPHGCGRGGPRDIEILFRILTGLIHHPNIGGVVLIGLGCEVSNTDRLLPLVQDCGKPLAVFNVQQDGGSLSTARKGVEAVRDILAQISSQTRVPMPWEALTVAMECGGSDALSGVTANVALGAVADFLVSRGATVVFGENTEMIGTAHVLTQRARDEAVAKKIQAMIDQAEETARRVMGDLAARVISPGNMDGGMSTIAEKSMGCIIKGGTSTIRQVVDYGERPTEKGLVLQNGPGYDADSLAGLAAGGAQVIFFSTGRGTPLGFPAVPVIKVASNHRTFQLMRDDMDINAGVLIDGRDLSRLREEMVRFLVKVVNGEKTKAEQNAMDVFTFMTVHPPF